jgi:hypothetical protein
VAFEVGSIGELADPLRRRTQLPREVLLDRRLQRAEAVEAELGGESNLASAARSATVPKATSWGRSSTAWATRRSAAVS